MNTWKPVVSRKAYKVGGQVDDLTDPTKRREIDQRAVQRDAKWGAGHVLSGSQQQRKQDQASQVGLTVDYTGGGPVAGGAPGKDTVPVVTEPGGSTAALLDNGEYVLPKTTTNLLGKANLDGLVKSTTGEDPVGADSTRFEPMKFGMGGFFDRFRNRGKQIDDAVDAAAGAGSQPVAAVEPPAPKSTSMRDIMRDIRKKNPPRKEKVRGYAKGGQPPLMTEAERKQQLLEQEQARMPSERIRDRMQNAQPLPKFPRPGSTNNPNVVAELGQFLTKEQGEAAAQEVEQAKWKQGLPPVVPSLSAAAEIAAPAPAPEVASSVVAPQESFIRRAGPDDLVPLGDAAFSPENVARARSEAQTFEANNPLSQARTVDDINADTAALRDLRRVKTNLADGRPSDYGEPQVAAGVAPKISDMLGIANFQRNLNKDQRAASQEGFQNKLALLGEGHKQTRASNVAQDRFLEQAEALAPEVDQQMPWMAGQTGSFFQRASELTNKGINPRQAAQALAETTQLLGEDTEDVLFEVMGDKGKLIKVTGVDAIAVLNDKTPYDGVVSGYGDKFYDKLRLRAAKEVQARALKGLTQ